jgi:hypothetical protein
VNTIKVEVRGDHIAFLAQARPLMALAELMWNALDADASLVRVAFAENELGGLETVRVTDDGHGLSHADALVVFRDLGGSWKRDEARSAHARRALHGKFGKGRFRAFGLGNHVQWQCTYLQDGAPVRFTITGHASRLGEFAVSDPEPAPGAAPGVTVEINDLHTGTGALRGEKAVGDVTDLFALYLRQYPGVRVVYDHVPLDPSGAVAHEATYDLGELVNEDGLRFGASMAIVEWNRPGRRGIVLCDAEGFALGQASPRILFRGFSYTAFLQSDRLSALDAEGLLDVPDMAADVRQLTATARETLRGHFARRLDDLQRDRVDRWVEAGVYPYDGEPASEEETAERRVFDIYAAHLEQFGGFGGLASRSKRLAFRMLRELVQANPMALPRILDDLATLPRDQEEAVRSLLEI